MEINRHHLLWQNRHWNKGNVKALRMHPYCIVHIPADTLHRIIHEQIRDIPVPAQINAKEALNQIRLLEKYGGISEDDTIEKRLVVLIALFECAEQPTADALKKQLDIVRKFNKRPP